MTVDGTLGETYATRPYPFGIAAGPAGRIWFCVGYGNAIGRITPG
jgi:streptogramin lyase